jgi:flagellar hook-basal body complex protein FliE
MAISNINSFSAPTGFAGLENRISTTNLGGDSDFGSFVKEAVESIDGANKTAEQEITKSVTGESTDLHKTIIALQTADMKLQLGLQVRNKLIGAYEEIMRMQV